VGTLASFEAHYWRRIQKRARELGSDGCSGAPDFYELACLEHDVHYRTGRRLCGKVLTRWDADARFLRSMRRHSPLGRWDPLPYLWWAVVRCVGWRHWCRREV
jgi:hypothetical protein